MMTDKTKKILKITGIIGGVLLLGGIGYYFYKKNQDVDESTEDDSTRESEIDEDSINTSKTGVVHLKPKGVFAINLITRQPKGTIEVGDTVTVTGTDFFDGERKVAWAWIDKKGQIGYVYFRPTDPKRLDRAIAVFKNNPNTIKNKGTISW